MRETGGADPSSAFLRVVLVGPSHPRRSGAARHTTALAHTLRDAGHEVTLVAWKPQPLGGHAAATDPSRMPSLPTLGWARPDSWWRSGRRLRGADAVVLVHSGIRSLPALLALLRGLGLGGPRHDGLPRLVLVAEESLAHDAHSAAHRLTASLVRRCDAVLVHDASEAEVARGLGATRVSVTPRPAVTGGPVVTSRAAPGAATDDASDAAEVARERVAASLAAGRTTRAARPGDARPGSPGRPGHRERGDGWTRLDATSPTGPQPTDGPGRPGNGDDLPELPADWARYVGAIEALVAPTLPVDPEEGLPAAPGRAGLLARVTGVVDRGLVEVRDARAEWARTRPVVPVTARDLPEWIMPTDVLTDGEEAADARRTGRALGLPRVVDATSAWAALGALAAIVRVVDDGRRTAVVVDESGRRSPLTRWARAVGFEPVELGLTGTPSAVADLDLDLEALDVIARVHPHGCDADDVDEAVGQASWALRPGGILIVTLPLAIAGVAGAVTVADVRGIVARAHEYGLVLVGDLDGDVTARASAAATAATAAKADQAAYGLVRLTFRRG